MRGRRGGRLLISLDNGKINEVLQLMRQFAGRGPPKPNKLKFSSIRKNKSLTDLFKFD